jgi:hypothetical protein
MSHHCDLVWSFLFFKTNDSTHSSIPTTVCIIINNIPIVISSNHHYHYQSSSSIVKDAYGIIDTSINPAIHLSSLSLSPSFLPLPFISCVSIRRPCVNNAIATTNQPTNPSVRLINQSNM